MKRPVAILFLFFYVCGRLIAADTSLDSLMKQLDYAMDNHDVSLAKYRSRLKELRDRADKCLSETDKFFALGDLYDAYLSNNADSAIAIAAKREEISKNMGDKVQYTFARLNTANILSLTGSYTEALKQIKEIQADGIPEETRAYYYYIMRLTYGNMSNYAVRNSDSDRYSTLTNNYRDSLLKVNEVSSVPWNLIRADAYNAQNEPQKSIDLLLPFIENTDLSIHDQAIFAYTLAESYRLLGDLENEKKYLLISAIADLESGVREYVSPRKIALILYREGDIERAYKLMTLCLNDAIASKSRQRIFEINEVFPMINEMYLSTIDQQHSRLTVMVVIIGLLGLLLVALLIYVYKQMVRARSSSVMLASANNELRDVNKQLSNANASIAEQSMLTTEYIASYMEQCLNAIDNFSAYRKHMKLQLATGNVASVTKEVNSDKMIDQAFKDFYDDFDKTFLRLFPTFIDEFNALLIPEERIIPKKSGSLTPVLRIYALIKLGITDSSKIARFLRYSTTTIYNYRTRTRNAAIADRDKFEDRIRDIGSLKNV